MSKQWADTITPEIQALLDRGLQSYIPEALPDDLQFGILGMCFDYCALLTAQNWPKYGYVEGIARLEGTDEWTLHAWLTDGVYAFDPTWYTIDDRTGEKVRIANPVEYRGVELNILAVHQFMKQTGYQSVICNRWRNEALADACWPQGVSV